ncbi:MAG: outer membrane lipoprotein-sorting protein [Elusimicrobia bacterium]|jgi:outer membrane lipoprotein-sorting protein|nr:outer membrane lipoprotein-sorting protein [Elusimicrobiota bacterium]
MKITKTILLFVIVISLAISMSYAEELTALKIIQNVYSRAEGEDMQAELTMTLMNKRGNKRERKIKQYSKDYDAMEKKVMFFISPSDVRDTSFMNWSYDEEGRYDDQWIYLPALKRIKRISSDSKSDYFMGSDFTYDDLGDRHPYEDTHRLLREEKFDNEDCYVVESIPKEEEYMYSKTATWIIKDKWLGLKKEFYDEDGDLLKVLSVKKYEKIKDYWIITNTEMHNKQKDHMTKMMLADIIIDGGIDDTTFTERIMKRGVQ